MKAIARHPQWLLLVVAAVGWVGLARLLWLPATPETMSMPPGHHLAMAPRDGMEAAPYATYATAFGHALLVWGAMVVAMMLPTTVPMVRYVAFATRRARRQRSILLFCVGYLTAWMLLGLAVATLAALLPPLPTAAVVVVVACAALWELTPIKWRALRRCHRTRPVRYRGWAADRSAAGLGWRHGLTCLLIGGPAMVALMAAAHPAIATIAVAALMLAQKGLDRPERWRAGVAVGGLLTGLMALSSG